jgi:transposase
MVKAPDRKEHCECCGSSLGEPSSVDHRIVEEISNPAPRQVINYPVYEYTCPACGSSTVSRHPECPPTGRFGRNALVQATILKFMERLPHRKVTESMMRTYGLMLTPATVLDVTWRAALWLRP